MRNYKEIPQEIKSKDITVFGVLSQSSLDIKKDNLLILIPSVTGTRIGPQRIFVEIARKVTEIGFSSFRFDFHTSGDSRLSLIKEKKESYTLTKMYEDYLSLVVDFHKKDFKNIYFLTISLGAELLLRYIYKTNFPKIIFLSPTYLNYTNKKKVNTKNVKAYKGKIFKVETWIKLLKFDINLKKIHSNIFPTTKKNNSQENNNLKILNAPEIYSIYGSNDLELSDSKNYWENLHNEKKISTFSSFIIEGADHSFFGTAFKEKVKNLIVKQLSTWKN